MMRSVGVGVLVGLVSVAVARTGSAQSAAPPAPAANGTAAPAAAPAPVASPAPVATTAPAPAPPRAWQPAPVPQGYMLVPIPSGPTAGTRYDVQYPQARGVLPPGMELPYEVERRIPPLHGAV